MNPKIILLGLSCLLLKSASAQWNSDPAVNDPVCLDTNNQVHPQIVSDGNGGAIICWTDFRHSTNNIYGSVYAQRIRNGVNQWTTNGIAVDTLTMANFPKIVSDGKGGAIISWVDFRHSNVSNQEADVYAQRIDSMGNKLWADSGMVVGSVPDHTDGRISLIPDGYSGAFITWDQSGNTMNSTRIHAQHIDSTGTTLWGAGGNSILVSSPSYSYDAFQPKIARDYHGGAVICWKDNRVGDADRAYAQRLDSLGNKLWGYSDVSVCSATYSDVQDPDIVGLQDGGAIITWSDTRTGTFAYSWNIYAQRISSSGSLAWAYDGVPVTNAQYNGKFLWPFIAKDDSGGAFISFYDNQLTEKLLLQHIDTSGVITWPDSLIISPTVGYPGSGNLQFEEEKTMDYLTSDSAGNAVVAWTDTHSTSSDIYLQKISISGSFLLDSAGAIMCSDTLGQSDPQVAIDPQGNEIVSWADFRNGNIDIYASAYPFPSNSSGINNNQGKKADELISIFPNPGGNNLNILNRSSNGKATVQLYDITEKSVQSNLIEKGLSTLDVSHLPNGIYVLRISTKENFKTFRWIKSQ